MFPAKFPLNIILECENLIASGDLGKKVRNKTIFSNEDFVVMLVIGPNNRSDYHVNSKQVRN